MVRFPAHIVFVVPEQFFVVVNSSSLAHSVEGKQAAEFIKRVDLTVVARTPAQVGKKIDQCFRFIMVGDIISGINRNTFLFCFPFGEFTTRWRHDKRKMCHHRRFPFKIVIKKNMFRCTAEPFLSTNHMGDFHQMVVYYIGEVVGWHTV